MLDTLLDAKIPNGTSLDSSDELSSDCDPSLESDSSVEPSLDSVILCEEVSDSVDDVKVFLGDRFFLSLIKGTSSSKLSVADVGVSVEPERSDFKDALSVPLVELYDELVILEPFESYSLDS
jgi:hypothetical protein